MTRYLTGLVCCLLTVSTFSEEERSKKLFVKDISVASTDTSANPENLSSIEIISTDEALSQGGSITFESTSKDSLQQEIAYPIEESDYEETSGRNQ